MSENPNIASGRGPTYEWEHLLTDVFNRLVTVENTAAGGVGATGDTGPPGPPGPAGLGRWRGTWDPDGAPVDALGGYVVDDLVVYQGTTYLAVAAPTIGEPPANNLDWDVVAQAGVDGANGTSGVSFTYQGTWISGTPYTVGQWVTYNGDLYYCNGGIVSLASPPDLDPGWNLGLAGAGAGLTPGQAPMAPIRAGAYLLPVGAGAGNSTATSVGTVHASPIYIPAATTIDTFGIYIVTGTATALWRIGLYADTGTMYPGALVHEAGTVDAATTGVKEITPVTPVPVTPGVYWVAGKTEVVNTAARGTLGPIWGVIGTSGSSTGDMPSGYLSNQAAEPGLAAIWPAWGVAGTGTINTAARVGVRVTG